MPPFGARTIALARRRARRRAAARRLPAEVPPDDYYNYRLAFVGIYFIAILGLNVLTGYNGQISLGHGAFMAIGAYTTAILNVELRRRPLPGRSRSRASSPACSGSPFGFPALRLSRRLPRARHLRPRGLDPARSRSGSRASPAAARASGPLPSSPIGGLSTNEWISYLTWAIAGVMFALAWFLLRGDLGRAFRAVRDAPIAAISSGISLARYKTLAFGIAAAYAGVAGALLTIAIAFVNPDTFPVSLSILLLTGAVVGGLGSLEGMLFGAVFIQFAPGWGERLAKHRPLQRGHDPVDRLLRADPAARALRDARRRCTTYSPTGHRVETSKAVVVQSRGLTRDSVTSRRRES